MAEQNLQMVLAAEAVHSMDRLNTSRHIELYEKLRLAREENDETAKTQRKQALPHGLSAGLSIVCSLAGEVLKNAGNPMGEALSSVARTTPEGAKIWSTALEGKVTHHSHTTREAQVAQDRIASTQQTTDKRLSDIVENTGRLLAKEV